MTISGRDLMKTFGAAACAMCWLRKTCGGWEWRRKLAAMLIVAALAIVAGEAETQSARECRRVTQAHAPASVTARTERNALDAYGKMALAFVPNAGQTDQRVRFTAQAGGASFYFTPSEAVFAFTKEKKGLALRLSFIGANPAPQIAGARRGAGRINYLIGNDPSRWRAGLATYEEIVYRDLWPGIDLAFRGENGELKYEFHLAPGADPRDIRLAYRGAERLALGPDGELLIHTAYGVLSDSRPVSYQEIAGARVPVASKYSLAGSSYGIVPDPYDPNRPLVIDPGLAYSTFLGGIGTEAGSGIAVDASGSAYVTGATSASNFPTTVGAFDATFNGGSEVFVTKLNPQGSALEYSTYLGGSSSDSGVAITVDAAGAAYVTGATLSSNFPTTPGAFDTSYNGSLDAFVTRLDPTGATLVYSTYLGGSVSGIFCSPGPCADEAGQGIAVDAAGNTYVAGWTRSANFPTTPGAFDRTYTSGANGQVFVTKLDSNGSALIYSTYLGGGTADIGLGIAIDNTGAAYVTGLTASISFPTTPGAFDTTKNNGDDAFVTKLNANGSGLVYSTFLGGSLTDQGTGIAIDAAGNAYVTGWGNSADFPTTPGAFDTTHNAGGNGRDAFVTKLNTDGSALVYSTYLGGSSSEEGFAITVDASGAAYVTGETFSANFPTTPGALDTTLAGNQDAFVTKLNVTGSAALYSTYLGGGAGDAGTAIFIDASGSVYVTGGTSSNNFPITPGAFQPTFVGLPNDAFVAKISNQPPNAAEDAATTDEDNAVTISVLANDTDPDGASLTLTDVTQGANGSVVINPDNTVTYSPAPNFNGADSFTYTVVDTWGDADTATVTVTINSVNDPPVAVDVSAATDEDLSVQINLAATDIDNSNLTFVVVSGPVNGALSAVSGASVTYTPNANFNGSDIFTFKANDETADSNLATVTITVAPVNDPPDAADDSASTDEDTAVTINVLANDVDVEGDTLSLTAVSQGANGAVTINPDSAVTYTPALNFFGSDSFTYTASDGAGGSDTATVNVNVASVQDTPSANDDAATVAEDSGPNAINVLANDSDVDGDSLAVASVTQGAHGSVVNNGSSVFYTPAPNYFGPDSFSYTVSDVQGGLDTATVNVTVTSVNDAPVANGDVYNTNFNTPLAVPAPGVLGNDADVEGDALLAALVTNVSNGTLSLASDGSFTYTPNPNFSGADSFTYRASDGTALSNVATVQITVVGGGGASRIVFSSNRDGNFEIYSMNTDGTAQTRLTNHSATDLFPALSPDGTKIAFASNRDGLLNFEIYVMNAGGSSPVRLTTNARVDGKPSWSPDGTKIAFTSARDGNFEIYSMNTDGSGLTRLTNNGAIDSDPAWSPDGTKIAFSSNRHGVLNFEICVMNADGAGVTRLTNNSALDVSPAWSPDGTRIAFASNRNGLLNFEVYVMNADGGAHIRLTINGAVDGEPAWSQDGARIVFSTNRDGVLNFEIYVMNADGSGQARLTTNSAADTSPDW